MKFKYRHPILAYKRWKLKRQHVENSKVNLYASRKHRLPLEKCSREQLEAAMRHNQREAARYEKAYERKGRQNYKALATWHNMCQTPIKELIDMLGDGQRVEDLSWKKRRKQTEELMRIRQLG